MLSKEEIEKAKKTLYPLSIGDFVTWFTTDGIVEAELATKTLFKYIEQQEQDKQKIIEKLEEKYIKYNNEYKKVEKLVLIEQNTTVLQELSCVLDDFEEILEILKGENDEL